MGKAKRRQRSVAEFEKIEIGYVRIRDEEFEQVLDEWAEIVYTHLSQLSEKKSLVPEFLTPLAAERSGTNG